jgi:hypothetical protein
MELIKDFWKCGIVAAEAGEIIQRASLDSHSISWLPGTKGLHYQADPFGLWRDGNLHVFLERFSYVHGVGHIEVIVLDSTLNIVSRKPVLREAWHLSYPYVFEADGETWMLPEASASGTSHLYRSVKFPYEWERVRAVDFGSIALDTTLVQHGGLWWAFYAPAFPPDLRLTTLHAAYAAKVEGPWVPHPQNPIAHDIDGARPGGTPLMIDGALHLPVQRATGSYGSGLRILRFDSLSTEEVQCAFTSSIRAPAAASPFTDGCHTLSAAGPVTLIDVKQRRLSPLALAAWPVRQLRSRRHAI